jgi:hypothetical protein
VSQRRRKIEEGGFGWMKTNGGLRKLRHGSKATAAAMFSFACAAHSLARLRTLLAEPTLARCNRPRTGLPVTPCGLAGR